MYKRLIGLILIGFVIKLMDDFLDQDLDSLKGEWNFAGKLGRGILPYSLVFIIIALYLNFTESVSFFAASYALGMFYDGNDRLPSHLQSWQEGLIICLISIYLTSLWETFAALILVLLIQFIDDFLDYQKDWIKGSRSLVRRLGRFNASLLTILLVLLAVKICPLKMGFFSIAVSVNYLFFWLAEKYLTTG
jgi:1,4-dihydroxy-2-naphthoate octaprenyltransferase